MLRNGHITQIGLTRSFSVAGYIDFEKEQGAFFFSEIRKTEEQKSWRGMEPAVPLHWCLLRTKTMKGKGRTFK